MPYLAMAAKVSPPPAMLKASLSAIARAIVSVPLAKASNSNTPTGPFHTMVPAALSLAASACAVCGPMSRIRSSAATSFAAFTVAGASALNSLATTTSVGIGTSAPRAFIAAITALAWSSRSGSARLLPIGIPAASRKVLAMPPPTIRPSTFFERLCRIVSLVLTLEPATMASSGRFGCAKALVMASISSPKNSRRTASISAASSGPAQAILANSAMP